MDELTTQATLDELARDLTQPITRYLERYVGDRAVAEELRQETLLRINSGFASFAGHSSIKTWAFSIANRVAADYLRHPDRRVRIVELEEVDEPVDQNRTNDELMVVAEMNACVRRVIETLPDPYRSALILHDLEGFSAEETAEICDSSLASAKIRVHRARIRLKEALKSRCGFYRDSDGVFRCEYKK